MKKSAFFRSPYFWIGLFVIAIASVFFLYFNFEKANPLVNISVEMSRAEALEKASALAREYQLGPKDFQQAASFRNDTKFQNYTELEGGGLEVFNQTIQDNIYQSYQWKVRQFKEKEVNEVSFSFTPSGELYGFSEKLGEDIPGAVLNVDSALQMATVGAENWQIDLNHYQLIEKSMDQKTGGRVDHEFVFERNDVKVNESKFRIAIVVSGDKVTSIRHFVKIPDDFDRRFAEMRSANNLISTIGQAILFLLYGLLGVGGGIFFLLKRRFIVWRKALYWSIGIGLGVGLLDVLNVMPLLWFDYDTSEAAGSFLGQQVLYGLLNSFLMGGIVFISALAGEGLSRYLFKDKIQFWKIWGKNTGASVQVLGQTLGAYLFVPAFLALDVIYYLITTNYFGWWNPAGTLSDPDILAQNLPWFGSIAVSLQAGFWEEIICRAVPLAGVYLLVRNLKSKNWWMILTLFAQTLIFGSLHASYPQSPAYARVLEMVVPFIIFGLIYLRFGLLPVIIAHYAVDVFWISLPLWVANSPGIWMNRSIIVLLFFVPLWVVLYWRIKNKKWNEIPSNALNEAWQPLVNESVEDESEIEERVAEPLSDSRLIALKWLIPGAIIGLILWGVFTFSEKDQTPKVEVYRNDAIELATSTLSDQFNFNQEGWSVLTSMDDQLSVAHKFIWQEFEESYDELQESFLNPPSWLIRFVKPDAAVEERAEEYMVRIGIDGRLLAYRHVWPEKKESVSLNQEEALHLAQSELRTFANVNTDHLQVVNMNPSKLEARTDWEIEFSDTVDYVLEMGQGRYLVSLAGNEVNGIKKYLYVPENWQRQYDKQRSIIGIFTLISNLFLYAIIIFGIVLGFINWSRKRFSSQMFIAFGLIFLVLSSFRIINAWDDILARYFTGLPYSNFITMTLIGAFIGVVFLAMGIGVIGGFSCEISKSDTESRKPVVKAILVGLLLVGLQNLKMSWLPQLTPHWLELGNLNNQLPPVGIVLDQVQGFIFKPVFAIILFYLIGLFTKNYRNRKALGITFIFVAGFLASGIHAESLSGWIGVGISSGIIFILLFLLLKNHLNWMPLVYVVSLMLEQVKNIWMDQFAGLALGSVLSIAVWGFAAYFWYIGIRKCNISK
ncbi:MAG: CPBP family intramembrane glutamic endopeptidase [Prolixibacteraceae bacterium]